MNVRVFALFTVVATAAAGLGAQTAPREVALLVTNGTVVTMDAGRRVLQDGGVAIDGSDIVAVDTSAAVNVLLSTESK